MGIDVTVLFIVALGISFAVGLRLSVPRLRRRRIESELHRDWWPEFEREFRAYAGRRWHDASPGERRG